MAYAFSQLTDLINQQGAGNANIFQPTSQGTPGVQGSNPPSSGSSTTVKTDTSGDTGSGVGTNISGGPTSGSSNYQYSGARPDMSAYSANIGKSSPPQAFSDIQNQISSNQSNLQNTANQYVSNQEANQNYNVAPSTVNSAVTGDQSSMDTVRGLLNRQNINAVDPWKGPNTNIPDANLLSTDAGISQLIGRGQSPSYTPGMASFDLTMMRANPDFQNLISKMQGSYGDFQTQANTDAATLPKQVSDYGTQNLQSSQNAVKGSLADTQNQILAAEQKASDAQNANLAQFKQSGAGAVEQQAADTQRAALLANLQAQSPRSTQFVSNATIDPSQYISFASGYNPNQFVSADQANQYNNIAGLLNQNQSQVASGALAPEYTMNNQGMYNALQQQVSAARAAQDATDQTQQAKILADAQAYANTVNTNANAPLNDPNFYQNLIRSTQPDISQNLDQYFNINPGMMDIKPNILDVKPYVSQAPANYSAQQVLNADQANQLNNLNTDLGVSASPYTAWSGTAAPTYNFQKQAYENALNTALQSVIANQAKPAPTPIPPQTIDNTGAVMPTGTEGVKENSSNGVNGNNNPSPHNPFSKIGGYLSKASKGFF